MGRKLTLDLQPHDSLKHSSVGGVEGRNKSLTPPLTLFSRALPNNMVIKAGRNPAYLTRQVGAKITVGTSMVVPAPGPQHTSTGTSGVWGGRGEHTSLANARRLSPLTPYPPLSKLSCFSLSFNKSSHCCDT